MLHCLPYPTRDQPVALLAGNLTVVAPEVATRLAHVVLKWLHQLLAYMVIL